MCRGASILYFNAPFFCCYLFFEDISTTLVRIKKDCKQCWLPLFCLKISLNGISFHISIKPLRLYLFPEWFLNFLSNLYIPPCVGKFSNLWCSHSEKMDWIYTFLLMSLLSTLKSRPQHTLARGKLFIPPVSMFLKICFPH